ncbi:MAG: hypothetical protein WHX93_18480, partial [bacterium]
IVFDEWLWADLADQNETTRLREDFLLLNKTFERCDQLVIVDGSPFVEKFWHFAKMAQIIEIKGIVKMFKNRFMFNSEKAERWKDNELCSIPKELEALVKDDDQYLVRAYLTAGADVLVTTDGPLLEVLNQHRIHCCRREDFLWDYLYGNMVV